MTDKVQFQYVVSRDANGNQEYYGRRGWYQNFAKARLFKRICDAKNSKGFRAFNPSRKIVKVVVIDPN